MLNNYSVPNPAAWIDFMSFQNIEEASAYDTKKWHGWTSAACKQIEDAKRNTTDAEKERLSVIQTQGAKICTALGKRMLDLKLFPETSKE